LKYFLTIAAAVTGLLPGTAAASDILSEIVVTGQRRPEPLMQHAGNIAQIDTETLQKVGHQHVAELLAGVAGVWLNRGSGQEYLPSMRSPVFTGSGSCGAFLFLEDGIPIRPGGFCNVNQLFEVNTEQAAAIEVVRGPGNASYGSNALHGIVNVIMPRPGAGRRPGAALEIGANDYVRIRGELPFDGSSRYLVSAVFADDGGFRDESGYRQAKVHAKASTVVLGGELLTGFSASSLAQDTAGFIVGEDAYRDPALKRSNPNPEAFRDASSARLYGIWDRKLQDATLELRPYLRYSSMDFLQHFLPGKPLEENGQSSVGVMASVSFQSDRGLLSVGTDLEYADMYLQETQFGPAEGSDFLVETRPQGKHYDFTAAGVSAAPWVQGEWRFGERLRLDLGARFEYVRYDYENRMLDGNTRDDGSECGFGGCLYTRPASRNDDFSNIAPKLAATWAVTPELAVYINIARGFRAPQVNELYRLQNGQQVADLDSENIDSVELGLRIARPSWSADLSIYDMKKHNSVLRDAEGFSINGGRSTHEGVEARLRWQLSDAWALSSDLSYARHRYDFDLVAARGETFVAGRDVDTAPRLLGNVELDWQARDWLALNLQWLRVDKYFLDAENRFTYPGHDLINVRAFAAISERLQLGLRINNAADRDYADRADYAFGNYRYFPGRGREVFVELSYTRSESL
jgi:outer membrane receptor protein involved in Fe transport